MSYYIAKQSRWSKDYQQAGIGEELKSKINDPGPWYVSLVCKVKRYPFIKII